MRQGLDDEKWTEVSSIREPWALQVSWWGSGDCLWVQIFKAWPPWAAFMHLEFFTWAISGHLFWQQVGQSWDFYSQSAMLDPT